MSAIIDIRQYLDPGCAPTLVLVDLQQRFAESAAPFGVPHAFAAVAHCRAALEHARRMGFPVAFVRRAPERSAEQVGGRYSRWINGLQPLGTEMIFDRDKPSCYASDRFAEVMQHSRGNFVLAGLAAEAACLSTAVDAFHRGHTMTLLRDASASHSLGAAGPREVHAVISEVAGLYGNVMATQAWISATSKTRRQRGTDYGIRLAHQV